MSGRKTVARIRRPGCQEICRPTETPARFFKNAERIRKEAQLCCVQSAPLCPSSGQAFGLVYVLVDLKPEYHAQLMMNADILDTPSSPAHRLQCRRYRNDLARRRSTYRSHKTGLETSLRSALPCTPLRPRGRREGLRRESFPRSQSSAQRSPSQVSDVKSLNRAETRPRYR